MSTGAQPPGAGVAPCQKCACCGKDAHSKGQSITEEQFYGVAPVTCASTGKTLTPDANYVQIYQKMKADCPKFFSEPPCNAYYIATKQDKTGIEFAWDGPEGDQVRSEIRAQQGEKVHHRVPKMAGGCPTGKGNLTKQSDLSLECQKLDDRLTKRQHSRIKKLREAAGIK